MPDPGRIVLTLPGAFRTLRLRRRSEAPHPSGLLALAGRLALDLLALDAETASVTPKFPKGESR